MSATSTDKTRMATRTGTGTTLKPSRKARDAAEAEAELQEEVAAPPRKKSKKQQTNNENRAPGESTEVSKTKSIHTKLELTHCPLPQFQFTTLSDNRVSKRACRAINLTAKVDGIPRAKALPAPAQVVAGQRQSATTPRPSKRMLTQEAAAHLLKMRSPFISPGQGTVDRRGMQQGGTAVNESSVQPQPRTPGPRPQQLSATPARPSSSSASRAATPRAATRPSQGYEPRSNAERSAMPPSLNNRVSTANRRAAAGADKNVPGPPSTQLSRERSPSPPDDVVGDLPRISKPYHALNDVDDIYSDPGVEYEDYAPNPREHANALAFGSQLNSASPQVYHFDDEEQEEMEQDPEADLQSSAEEEEVRVPQRLDDGDNNDDDDSAQPEAGNQQIVRAPHQPLRITDVTDDSLASFDGDEDMPEAQHRAVPPGKKVGVRDYEPHAQEVLVRAITIYKTHIAAENAYPDKLQEKTWAKAAWNRAMRELDIKIKADSRAIELIARNSWGLRGEIKGYARNFVPGEYGFKQVLSTDAEGVQRNIDLARQLLDANTFKYKDPSTRSDLFEGDIVQNIINKVFYKNPADDGVIHDEVYRPFPIRGVALVLTAIQNAIQEWATGVHQSVNFGEDMYEDQYKIHLKDLEDYEARSEALIGVKIVSEIRQKLSTFGRDHAKAPLTPQAGGSGGLPAADLDRAVAAYRRKLQNM
ncbi:hypothetical protein K466DRAFT_568481 [Polyporus arcularius HHB13444]|uniref:DUF6532 domain-containing protein n=1 Tax=Polyporus arcularius HHB13444 TaxID=1314778 RepID=A0A5C3P013_9APHY|nr:hypothetical protein K466DRAFT_568481 [Polyporus arcularius HHB13444]